MSKLAIIRTWKDKQYRNTFDSEQQALFFQKRLSGFFSCKVCGSYIVLKTGKAVMAI